MHSYFMGYKQRKRKRPLFPPPPPPSMLYSLHSSLVNSLTPGQLFFFSDPYVKVWLQFGDKRIEKKKTPVFKCTLNPVFNESFTFNVPWEKIRECSLDVMVMDFDNIGRNELIGRILLAGNSECFKLFTRAGGKVNRGKKTATNERNRMKKLF